MSCKSGDDTKNLRLLGTGRMPKIEGGPDISILEYFPNRFPNRPYIISMEFPEFTSLCPVTGQPDFGTIRVEYIPDEFCVESKSFKLYMFAFRNYQSFMETITNTILDDLVNLLKPCWCRVNGLFAPRGATRIHVHAENFKQLSPQMEVRVREAVNAWRLERNGQAGG